MARLRILMAASEAAPFARTGGLGDVMGALPGALAGAGHEVRVFIPRYGFLNDEAYDLRPVGGPFEIVLNGRRDTASLERAARVSSPVEQFFVANSDLFERDQLYVDPETGVDYADNHLRFAFFCRAVLESCRRLNWKPDIIHVHDWQTALVPVLLRTVYAGDTAFDGVRTVLTIHNLGYQGLFDGEVFPDLGLPEELFYAATGTLEFFGKVNFLKGGIVAADKVTTVSERYASEIGSSEEFGCGLHGVLATRSGDLNGILNGVDYSIWSPSRDKALTYRYSLSNLSGKRMSRVELLRKAGLPLRERVPLVAFVGRLTEQKGIDLIEEGAEAIFRLPLQMIVLGTGEEAHHLRLRKLERRYPDRLKVYLEFNDELAHRLQAGADILLMPSRYEPCGLNQMYALRYGTVPVVREVGGLADTVKDYRPDTGEGTGFVFQDYTPEAMIGALSRAVELHRRRQKWVKLMKTGMRQDFSWQRSAARYIELFESLRVPQPAAESRS